MKDKIRVQWIRAFTLMELLVVMAITAVMLGLLLGPMLQSFNFTRRVQRVAQAQDTARHLMETIAREIADAAYVFDNSRILNPLQPNGSPAWDATLVFKVYDARGAQLQLFVPYAKIDLVLPERLVVGGTGATDPTDGSDYVPPDRRVGNPPILPALAGRTVVRYFIALRDPSLPYNNRNEQLLAAGIDNPYILWRAQFVLYERDANGNFVPNTKLFKVDNNGQPIIDEPWFFYDTSQAPNGRSYMQNWLEVSRPVTEAQDIDLINIVHDPQTGAVRQVTPLIQFLPGLVADDPATPTVLGDAANEVPNATPTAYTTKKGGWSSPFVVTVYRNLSPPLYYSTLTAPNGDLLIGRGSFLFNISAYQRMEAAGCYDEGTWSPDVCSNLPDPWGGWGRVAGPSGYPFLACSVDPRAGTVNFALPASVLFSPGERPVFEYLARNTQVDESERRYLLLSEPDIYNGAMNNRQSPLRLLQTVSIVPGSEQIWGPDQTARPGEEPRLVLYTRVPWNATPGPNQYRINYRGVSAGQGHPSLQTGYVEFWPLWRVPEGNRADGTPYDLLRVTYYIQTNTAEDIVKVDYMTRSLYTLAVTIKLYDPTTRDPLLMSLSTQVRVRNLLR